MATRNIQKEQEALKRFGETQGKMPSSSEDWALLHQYAYGNDIPAELKATQKEAAPAAGVAAPTASPVSLNPEQSLGTLATGVEQAGADYQKFTQPTMALNLLQDAIREKTGVAKAGIGESEIFKQAGITGYAPLAQSLNTRGDELAINQAAFQNVINSMAGNYKDMANAAYQKYTMAMDNYNAKKDELLEAERFAREHAEKIELINLQNTIDQQNRVLDIRNSKEMDIWKAQLESGNINLNTGLPVSAGAFNFDENTLSGVFNVGDVGGECGDFTHTISDGVPAMGNSYEEKISHATLTTPEIGSVMVLKTRMPFGHAATVIGYNPETGEVKTVESNWNGDKKITIETRNLKDIPDAKFIPGTLKEQYQGLVGTPEKTADSEVESYVQQVSSGKLTSIQALQQITPEKKAKLIEALASAPSEKDTAVDSAAKEKVKLAQDLEKHRGLPASVGTTWLGRVSPTGTLLGWKQDFIAGVEQLVSGLSLESLIEAKSRGATFGALSDSEMNILASSASKIGTWTVKDKDGNVKGYNTTNSNMVKEIKRIESILNKGIINSSDLNVNVMDDGTQWELQLDGTYQQIK